MAEILTEHLNYLSMAGRKEIFERAISTVLAKGDKVADLGCGFGVLGIACLRAGAAHVYGIDRSDAIEIARETVRREGLESRYTCIRGSTFDIELPEKVDAIICDHVGWFGFDYGLIAMLRDAKSRLLRPGGTIVPRALHMMIASTSSTEARSKAAAWRDDPVPAEYHWLEHYGLNTKHPYFFKPEDIATAPQMLGAVDLTADTPDDFHFTAKLTSQSAHVMQGLAGWFECELAENAWMTNSPIADGAIARNQVFLPIRNPIALGIGEEVTVTLRFRFDNEMFAWSVRGPDGRRQKMSTFKAAILGAADLGRSEPC